MRKRTHMLLAFALALLAAPSAAFGQESYVSASKTAASPAGANAAEEVLRLEREYEEANKRHDAEAVARLHAEDIRVTARGRVTQGAELLSRLRDKSRPRDVIESLTTEDVRARDYGQTVVTTGRWRRVSKDAAGKDTSAEGHFTRVWVRRGDGWQLAVAHYSPVARPPQAQPQQ